MTSLDSSLAPDPFLQLAVKLSLLHADTAERLAIESLDRRILPAQLALQKGVLTATQVDIVQTLLRPDDAVPGYELLSPLGHGGMGVVYRARQKNLNRTVAVKTVLIHQMGDDSIGERFKNEAKAVARLAHPHIVAAYDFGQHDGRLYFVMEYVEGEDLQRHIRRRGPLDERTTWGLIRQAAAGLSHAAELGIVHRDIKPANLLLVDPPTGFPLPSGMKLVKVADFGLARFTTEADERTRLTSSNHTIGSPHYMSPEQLRGEEVDSRSDIYALGCTAYHMLAGKPPLAGMTVSQIAALKLTGDLPGVDQQRPEVSRSSAHLISWMTSLRTEDRPQNYQELFALIDGLNVSDAAATQRRSGTDDEKTSVNDLPTIGVTSPTQRGAGPTDRAIAMADALTATAPIIAPVKVTSALSWKRHWPAVVLTACLTALLLALVLNLNRHQPTRPLVSSGFQIALFDGQSLAGWKTLSGAWHPARNDEGSPVLAGSDGVAERVLPESFFEATTKPTSSNRVRPHRLTVFVELHEATAAEIHFGIAPSGERQVVRLSNDESSFGKKASDQTAMHRNSDAVPLARKSAQHDVQIERQPSDWWVLVDGRVVGAIAARDDELPEVRLLAEGGPAWFSDITVEELGARPSPP